MLSSLNITNVVLIDRLMINFQSGLCVLTGETGAGKSVLLDSLGLALGMRAESGLVRKGTQSASVTAAFTLSPDHKAYGILGDADIHIEDDLLLLRRVVYSTGKSRAFVNDQPVSISFLKKIGDTLVEIHGQFETQGLLNPSTHGAMLDAYAKIDLSPLQGAWRLWKDQEIEYADMVSRAAHARDDEEYLRLSLDDLKTLSPQKGEERQLAALRERLKHRADIIAALSNSERILGEDNDPVQRAWALLDSVMDKAGAQVVSIVDILSRVSDDIAASRATILTMLSDFQDSDDDLESIDDRLYALRMQARKHHCDVDDLPSVLDDLAHKLSLITNNSDALAQKKAQCDKARHLYIDLAQDVHEKRLGVGRKLDLLVQDELVPLKLDKARFVTDVAILDEIDWGASGMDQVRFLVATNPGQEAGAIHKIASGGEMSRFMLALKVIIAQAGSTHSFIFDEVDAGIGGATADAVGERLKRLAQSKQVLVVTHAPQVAARADHHWVVSKSDSGDVKTDIVPLSSRIERCEEIARMLAGADITNEARAAAEKLMDVA